MAIDERLEEIKSKWNFDVTLPMAVPWGKDDVVWLVGEVERLRAEAKRLDEAQEEIERLRAACTIALSVMEQKNRVNVPPLAKFVEVKFTPEDVAVLRAALEKKP